MARLSERERQILSPCATDGKTQMEVSSEIGISQAQVSRLEKRHQEHQEEYRLRQKGAEMFPFFRNHRWASGSKRLLPMRK